MALFYVEVYGRGCKLIAARSLQSAWAKARHDDGWNNVQRVRPASNEDIGHIRAMGGRVPEKSDY